MPEKVFKHKWCLANAHKLLFNLFCSHGLASALLFMLFVLTYLGTLEQVDHGLYDVQQKYFNSLFLTHLLFDRIPIPLPGVYLVLVLLSMCLLCGAIIRARKSWRYPGMLIAHAGIMFLLFSGLVTYHSSIGGNMSLYEGERASEFESYHEWVVEIIELGTDRPTALTIPAERLAKIPKGGSQDFVDDSLPFRLRFSGYASNALPAEAGTVINSRVVDGFVLERRPRDKQSERNLPGVYLTVLDDAGAPMGEAILHGIALHPWTFEHAGRTWFLSLTRKRWQVPFEIALEKFTKEVHPGTNTPSVFLSDVTKRDGDSVEKIKITMNEPLRYQGYTFFQASWGPQDAKEGERLFSVFAVVKNPADQWPLYACIIVGVGFLIHFIQKLLNYLKLESRRQQDRA